MTTTDRPTPTTDTAPLAQRLAPADTRRERADARTLAILRRRIVRRLWLRERIQRLRAAVRQARDRLGRPAGRLALVPA